MIRAGDVAERFKEYRRLRWREEDWGALEPFFRRGSRRDAAAISRCELHAKNDATALALARLLRRMSVVERRALPDAIRRLRVGPATKKIFEHLSQDIFVAVNDLKCLELLYHETRRGFSQIIADTVPRTRNFMIELLATRLIIVLARVLDGTTSAGSDTASMEALTVALQTDGYARLARWMKAKLGRRRSKRRAATGIRRTSRAVLRARNKDVAHVDLRVLLDKRRKTGTSFAAIRSTIEALAGLLTKCNSQVNNEYCAYTQLAGAGSEIIELREALVAPSASQPTDEKGRATRPA